MREVLPFNSIFDLLLYTALNFTGVHRLLLICQFGFKSIWLLLSTIHSLLTFVVVCYLLLCF